MNWKHSPWSEGFRLTFGTLTSLRMPVVTPTAENVRKSIYFYPLAGLFAGVGAAVIPVLSTVYLGLLQAFVLFTGCIYVFLLAWLSGFSGFRAFCRFSDIVSYKHITPAERRTRLEHYVPGAAGIASCAILAAGKMLIVYLLFTRLAIFNRGMLLGFFLILAPVASRILMVWAASRNAAPDEPLASPAGKGSPFFTLLMIGVVLLVSWAFLTLSHGFGEFLSLTSGESFSRIACFAHDPAYMMVQGFKAFRDVIFLFLAGFLAAMYVNGESKAMYGGMTEDALGALAEIGEVAVLTAGLLVADYMLF